MKNFRFSKVSLVAAISLLAVFGSVAIAAAPEPLRVQIQLIWGTNDQESPDPKHKAIDPDLAKKLGKAPYRWKNYFEVNRQMVKMSPGEIKTAIAMSKQCVLDLKNLGDGNVEIKLYGNGKHVSTHKEKLIGDWPLILAGDAKNDTAWMVVIKKLDLSKTDKPLPK
jgi:hypothetical protein